MSTPGNNLRNEITRRLEAFCADRGYVLSENREPLIEDLVRMYELLGEFYCPCQVGNSAETVCVCTAVKRGLVEEQGACFCGLIRRGKEP